MLLNLDTAYSCDLHVMRNDRFHLSPNFFFYRFKRCPLRFIMCMFNGRNIVDVHLDIFFNDYSIVHIYVHSLWQFVHQKKFTLLWMFILNGNKNSQKKFKFECSVKTKTCMYIHLCVALLYMANKTCTHS